MFSLSSLVPSFGFGGRRRAAAGETLDLPPVEEHDVETAAEKRARTLKHLLKANHANYSVIYHHLQFHNHTPHILGSAYIFGSSPERLNEIYDKEIKSLEPWRDSPGEVTKDDWREYLGKREYQRAYIDFFEDQLVQYRYDWRKLLEDYFLSGDEPLINNVICGLGHPLIHLGYAHELSSRTIAIEALALSACFHNALHKYLDDPSYTFPPPSLPPPPADIDDTGNAPLRLLTRIRTDSRFDGLFDSPGAANLDELFAHRERAVLEYWNAWTELAEDPKGQFEASQRAAVALLVATGEATTASSSRGGHGNIPVERAARYDFFLVHLLTTSHAVRVLLPHLPATVRVAVVRQWWLFTVAVYACQLRPEIRMERIRDVELDGRGWEFVQKRGLEGERGLDAHYVKALRVMKEAAHTWGDPDQFFLKAAVKFAIEFDGWGGFGSSAEADEVNDFN